MAANTAPIFPTVGQINFTLLATANTALDGTGTAPVIFTAAANGSRLDTIKIRHKGTNVATVLRIFLNNGSTAGTSTNNTLYMERSIAANTLVQNAESIDYEIPMDLVLPSGWTILVTIGTTVAAGLHVSAIGGNY